MTEATLWDVPAHGILWESDVRLGAMVQAVENVIRSRDPILGADVRKFEREFARYCKRPSALGLNSGTDALVIALRALDIGPGDEVITTATTFTATASAIVRVGAIPVFVDISRDTWTLDPIAVEEAITDRTRAVLPVHLYGCPADMEALARICVSHGFALIADAAQAVGSRYKGMPIGHFGDIAAFSFFPTKNLAAFGDAGAIVSSDRGVMLKAMNLREHGISEGETVRIGYNSRLDSIQAAVLVARLNWLEEENRRRRDIARQYSGALAEFGITTPTAPSNAEHSFYQYAVEVPIGRDHLLAFLHQQGIEAKAYYELPLYRHAAYLGRSRTHGSMEVTDLHARVTLCLPCHAGMSDDQQDRVVEALRAWQIEPHNS